LTEAASFVPISATGKKYVEKRGRRDIWGRDGTLQGEGDALIQYYAYPMPLIGYAV